MTGTTQFAAAIALAAANGYTIAPTATQWQRREMASMQVAAAQAAPENVRAFIQEYFDAWKGTDEREILAYYSDDVVLQLPTKHSKGRYPCEITLSDRSSPCSLAMYIPFGTWPTPKIWSRWNGVLTPCTKAPLAKSRLRAKRFRFLVVPTTSTTSDPERFRQEESTSILLPSCGKLARKRKSPGGLTRNHATSL